VLKVWFSLNVQNPARVVEEFSVVIIRMDTLLVNYLSEFDPKKDIYDRFVDLNKEIKLVTNFDEDEELKIPI
jgi:hypothetical protein